MSGIPVSSTLDTIPSGTGNYGTHDDVLGKGGYRSVATFGNLSDSTIPTGRRKPGMFVYVIATLTFYVLAGDLTTWTPVAMGGTKFFTLANAAALTAQDLTGVTDGNALFFVQTYQDYFKYVANGAALTVDNKKVFATANGVNTRFVRQLVVNPLNAAQTSWAVDNTGGGGGSDENTGDAAHPLATLFELWARTHGLSLSITPTFTVKGTFDPNLDPLTLDIEFENAPVFAAVVIDFLTLSTEFSGTLTTVTAFNQVTNQNLVLGDGVHNWVSGDIGKRIRMTSGAASGASGYVYFAGGATAEVSPFASMAAPYYFVSGNVTPAPGDTYVVEVMSSCGLGEIRCKNPTLDQNIAIHHMHEVQRTSGEIITPQSDSSFNFAECFFESVVVNISASGSMAFENCGFRQQISIQGGAGFGVFIDGGWSRRDIQVGVTSQPSACIIGFQHTNNRRVVLGANSMVYLGGFVVTRSNQSYCISPDAGSVVYVAGVFSGIDSISGANNTAGVGVLLAARTALVYNAGANLKITGVGGDFKLAGATQGRAWDDSINDYTTLRNCTWALLGTSIAGGGFGGQAHNPNYDAHVMLRAF